MQQQNYVVPNSLFPKELRRYSSGRMARRRGELEEKLRAAVGRYVRPDGLRSEAGRNKAVAEAIGRPPSWVTEYINGENHANLDTSLALMRCLGWSLARDLKDVVAPPRLGSEAHANRHTRRAITLLTKMSDDGQKLAARRIAGLAAAFPIEASPKSKAPRQDTNAETKSKGRGTRKAAEG